MPFDAHDDSYVRTAFLERLAHELRGPAGVTIGALDQIERSLGNQGDAKLTAQLAMARRGVSRVVRAADRLQRTAQLERGNTEFALVACDVRGLVDKATQAAQVIDVRRGITFEVSSGTDPCLAAVDASWLISAIGEVVTNAIHFGRTKVAIDTRAIEDEIHVSVRDDGPGFSSVPALVRFEAPVQGSGLGLSLALVSEVLRAHGGRLDIVPHGDAGATTGGACVILRLPKWQGRE